MSESREVVDVAVVGAGFAGTWMALQLARQGHRVVLVERQAFGRFRPGGWLPSSTREALEAQGLGDVLRARYLASTVLRLHCARTGRARVFAYDESVDPTEPTVSLHAPRADLDLLLARAACDAGARGLFAVKATNVTRTDEGYALELRGQDASVERVTARVLVDATGESRWFSARSGAPTEREGLQGTVLDTLVIEAQAATGVPQGAAELVSFAHGAFWMLPLRGGAHALSAAVSAAWTAQRKPAEGPESFFERTERDAHMLRGVLSASRRIHAVTTRAPVAVRVNPRCGDRWLAVGAAAGTVDPILGMDSVLCERSVAHGLAVVHAMLRGEDESLAHSQYEAALDALEARAESIARAVYSGGFADVLLAPDLSRHDRSAVRHMLRGALEGEAGQAVDALATRMQTSARGS
ncbi:MAG: FAD-dependent oxidoreductase [Deltaproteobacteria bacterium]|nr:FAD-dependent oxidoreductase [Deltaproteobacteria bacterium]